MKIQFCSGFLISGTSYLQIIMIPHWKKLDNIRGNRDSILTCPSGSLACGRARRGPAPGWRGTCWWRMCTETRDTAPPRCRWGPGPTAASPPAGGRTPSTGAPSPYHHHSPRNQNDQSFSSGDLFFCLCVVLSFFELNFSMEYLGFFHSSCLIQTSWEWLFHLILILLWEVLSFHDTQYLLFGWRSNIFSISQNIEIMWGQKTFL